MMKIVKSIVLWIMISGMLIVLGLAILWDKIIGEEDNGY